MSERYSKSNQLSKSIFHYFNPRERFSRWNGLHARERFSTRYGKELTQKEYEIINIKIILGDYMLLASEKDSSALYTGIFRGVKFYAIFEPVKGNVVTFLNEGMLPSFMMRESSEIYNFVDDIVLAGPSIRRSSRCFISEEVENFVLEKFDSHYNYSIYRGPKDELVLYGHKESMILRRSRDRSIINEYVELNLS